MFCYLLSPDFVSLCNLGLMPLDIVVQLPTFVLYLTGPLLPLIDFHPLIDRSHPGNAIRPIPPRASGIARGRVNRAARTTLKGTAMSRWKAH